MKRLLTLFVTIFILLFCIFPFQQSQETKATLLIQSSVATPEFTTVFSISIKSINSIPLPNGYSRVHVEKKSFAAWLRKVSLRKNNTVFLYNNQPKANQSLHYAVLDISTGKKDLQQCADALMRLRAEYLFSISAYERINFISGSNTAFNFKEFAKGKRYAHHGQRISSYQVYNDNLCYTHPCLLQFLDWVFSYCGTYTLHAQTSKVENFEDLMPGDMLVKAGSPGHAMMVGDVAVNAITGKKIFLLVQGYMPAQDIHIVKNPSNLSLGPWYDVNSSKIVVTPGWTFEKSQLRRW